VTLRGLTHVQRVAKFGRFAFEPAPAPGNREAIRITDDWPQRNIATFIVPQLVPLRGTHTLKFHTQAGDALCELWAAWEETDLLRRVLSFNGAWVPRYKRGRGPVTVDGVARRPFPGPAQLSNHSWGTAFDINARWNPLGQAPVPMGGVGSVVELVEEAEAHDFAWGGHFASRPDGMHFEYVG
jgi:hypothetical protein